MPISALGRRAVAAAAVSLFVALAARADLTVVSTTQVEGGRPPRPGADVRPNGARPAGAQRRLSYFKGDKTRTDDADGSITLTDAATAKRIVLHPKKKTYFVLDLEQMVASTSPFAALMDFQVTGDIKPGDQTRTIAGKEAKNYLVALTINVVAKEGTPQAAGSEPLFSMTIEGQQWTTEALAVGGAGGLGAILPGMGNNPMMNNLAPLKEKLALIKGFVLASDVKVTLKSPLMPPENAGKPFTVRMEVVSVSDAALEDRLFALPKGFKKVDPPAPGGFGGGF